MTLSYSVVIPAYNAARTLAETLNSVFRQTLPPREVIVVDDGSSDATAAVARAFDGVRLIIQANTGPGPAFNAGMSAARSDVFAFLDADDLWVPSAMESQMSGFGRGATADAVVGDMEEFVCPSEPPEQASRFAPRARQLGWISGATAVRATSAARVGAFEHVGGGHWVDWMDRARRLGLVFVPSGELVLRRRLHRGSMTMNAKRGRNLLGAARAAIHRRNQEAGSAGEQRQSDP